MDLLEFSDKKIVGVVKAPYEITEEDIENIMVTAIEGGCNYWMGIATTGPKWDRKPKGVPVSQWATKLLLEGWPVDLFDVEDGMTWTLTLTLLFNGIEKEVTNNHSSADKNNWDAEVIDCMIQYSIFDAIVYG